MKDFIISCDQTSDLPERIREKVSTEKMVYMLDSVEFGGNTGRDMTIEEFYAEMRNGAVAKTSQVTEEEAFRADDNRQLRAFPWRFLSCKKGAAA